MFLEHEFFSNTKRASSQQEHLSEAGLILQLINLRLPLTHDDRQDEKALATIADRLLEELAERQLAELAMQLDPRRDAARYDNDIPAAHQHDRLAAEVVERPRDGRASRGVQTVQL